MRPLLLLGAVLATGLVALVHSQVAVEQIQISGTEVSDNQVVVAVSALDGAGNPVEGLSQGDFTALLDGDPLEILSLQPEVDGSLPLALIIVMDTSGSMAGGPLDAARQAIQPVLESLRPGDRAALISFAQTVTTTVPLTGDMDSLQAGLASLVAEGNTALYAAVSEAANLASSAPEPRRAMVLLSDGEDFGNVSSVTRDDSLGALAFSGVPAIVLALGDQTDVDYLSAVAGSEANLLTASAAADLAALYEQVSARLFLQYSLRVALPAGVEPGIHELAITSGGVTATASISVAASTAPSTPRLEGLSEPLEAEASVSVLNSPPGATIRVLIDGEAIAVADGVFTLDPFEFAPGTHELRVEFSPAGSAQAIVTEFTVAELAPMLLEPAEGTRVQPGDIVRLRFRAQPGPVTASFILDGALTGQATAPPYEYLVPSNLSAGDHELEVRLASEGGEVARSFDFSAQDAGGQPMGAYLIIGLCALLAAAAGLYGLRLFVARDRDRSAPLDTSMVSAKLSAWALARRATRRESAASQEAIPGAMSPNEAWGVLVVREGPDKGKRFELRADVELIGRGKACSVRLTDKSLEEAHFIIDRERMAVPSTPGAALEIDGAPGRRGQLAHGSTLRAGATVLQFETMGDDAWAPEPPPPV